MKYSKIIIIILLFFNIQAFSQSAISFDFFGLGYHPFENPNYIIYENSISSDGSWVIEPGIIFSYQKFILLTHTSIQLNQGLYSDASAQFAGYTGLSLKRKLFHYYKHSFTFALGVAYLYRDKWNDISRYVPEYDFVSGKIFETRFSYTCELKYPPSATNAFAISKPIPRPAPVTTATLSVKRAMRISFPRIWFAANGKRHRVHNKVYE